MLPINEVIDAILVDYTRTSIITKSYTKQFGLACQAGDLHTIKNILDYTGDINYGLVIACYYGDLGVIDFIIKKYAPIEGIDFNKVLHIICMKGFTEMVKYLINMCDVYDVDVDVERALYESCESRNIDLVKYVVEYANKQDTDSLTVDMYDRALWVSCGRNAFDIHSTVNNNVLIKHKIDLNIVKYLIEECKCKASDLHTALYYASYIGSLDVITYLIEKISSDEIIGTALKNGFINMAFKNACHVNTLEVIKYLATYGNNVDEYIIGSGLCRACSAYNGNCVDVIEYLINKCDEDSKKTALTCADIYKLYTAMKLLIENGAEPIIYDTAINELLNMGIEVKLLKNKADKFVEIRDKRNKAIKEMVMNNTKLCVDVIDVLCSYTEYEKIS